MAYFTFIFDIETAKSKRDEDLELIWSEKDNPLFDKEMCEVWGRYSAELTVATKRYREAANDATVEWVEEVKELAEAIQEQEHEHRNGQSC